MAGQYRLEHRTLVCVLSLLLAPLLNACSTIGYLLQAGKGQLALSNRARPIAEVLGDESVHPRIQALLAEVEHVKKFGEGRGIKPTANYTEYVQLDRPYASWVVSACEELSFNQKTWSFPIVGTVPYLGWFSEESARSQAAELKREGWDVSLRGVRAYSTLGWFRDAILSSMIPEGDEALGDLVEVVIHESVHATVYIPDHSTFNESLADFVAGELTPVYLRSTRGESSPELRAYLEGEKRAQEISRMFHDAYTRLDEVYRSGASVEEKRKKKSALLSTLRSDLRTRLGMEREVNNATLVGYRTYRTAQKEFAQLLAACGGDMSKFLWRVGSLKKSHFPKTQDDHPEAVVLELVKGGC